jgi:hypothetical protein
MWTITLAPLFSFVIEYFRKRLNLPKSTIIFLFILIISPILLIWATGYDFSIQTYHWLGLTIILTSICFIFLTILNVKNTYKFLIAITMTLPILAITFLGSLGAEFGGGSREILNKSSYKNYIAFELEPKMYEPYNTLIINKTMLNNIISKTIYETTFTDSSKKYTCDTYATDKKVQLKYDLCNHKLSIR